MQRLGKILAFVNSQPRWRIVAVVVPLALALIWMGRGGKSAGNSATFVARRGPLKITVLEGGSLQSLESQELKCEVRVGYNGTKILKIVEEGFQVNEDDVRTNKVLVELDSSDLEKQLVQQEIQFQSAAAALTDAQQGYDIQMNQNLSDVQAAQQDARFMRMDFDKFLGDSVTQDIVDKIGLDKELAAEAATSRVNNPPQPASQNNHTSASPPPNIASSVVELVDGVQIAAQHPTETLAVSSSPQAQEEPRLHAAIGSGSRQDEAPETSANSGNSGESPIVITFDFSKYARLEALGDGEAKQKLRKLEDDFQVSQKELGQAQSTLDGTKRLFQKDFVTKVDMERDEISFENARLKVQTAETARDLFLKYEFRRSAEDALSKYVEAARKLDRARKAAVSKIAQADAKLKSCQGQYNLQLRQRDDLKKQLAKCMIHATKPGLVVYGGSQDGFYWGPQEQVREGATVREQQTIITIPDMSRMAVKVRIHESYIKKVKKGQKAHITVDAFPDQPLEGVVTNVAVLPDSQNRWMNPDLKVYLTTILIEGACDWIKPGMSAKAEILVDYLGDVVYAPLQAIAPDNGKQYCYVTHGLAADKREVETGQFNDEFIEIKKGLKEGEKVLLHPPETAEQEGKKQEEQAPPKKQPDPNGDKVPAGRVASTHG